MHRRQLYLLFALLAVALFASACGKTAQPGPTPAAGETCFSCHTDEGKLLADLAANPLPQKEKGESEGEG